MPKEIENSQNNNLKKGVFTGKVYDLTGIMEKYPEVAERIEAEAEKEFRAPNGQIMWILKNYLSLKCGGVES